MLTDYKITNTMSKSGRRKYSQSGMKVGAVSLWLLILLSERPMYGYEIIRELEKRFSGHWKPKTGTIYPALEKLEQEKLVTGQREFREEGPDRKHYALAKKGEVHLSQSILRWIKMMDMLEHYRETHEAIFRYKDDNSNKEELSKVLINIGQSLKSRSFIRIGDIFPSRDKTSDQTITPGSPIAFKFLYAKENDKLEVHMELEWTPK
jgi:PadR family transcriptional regulator, regulatory protein PadR